MKGFVLAVLVLIAIVALGCLRGTSSTPSSATATVASRVGCDVNFVLYVLNASREREQIDIKVYIDGSLRVDDVFSSKPAMIESIAPHRTYEFCLLQGTHVLKAVSQIGQTSFEQELQVTGKHWALLGYDYWSGQGTKTPPNEFGFELQDSPIMFE